MLVISYFLFLIPCVYCLLLFNCQHFTHTLIANLWVLPVGSICCQHYSSSGFEIRLVDRQLPEQKHRFCDSSSCPSIAQFPHRLQGRALFACTSFRGPCFELSVVEWKPVEQKPDVFPSQAFTSQSCRCEWACFCTLSLHTTQKALDLSKFG